MTSRKLTGTGRQADEPENILSQADCLREASELKNVTKSGKSP